MRRDEKQMSGRTRRGHDVANRFQYENLSEKRNANCSKVGLYTGKDHDKWRIFREYVAYQRSHPDWNQADPSGDIACAEVMIRLTPGANQQIIRPACVSRFGGSPSAGA